MRWLFLLLLAANVIFFSWNWFKEGGVSSPYHQSSTFSLKGQKLVLLSELEPAPAVEPPPKEDKPAPIAPTPPATDSAPAIKPQPAQPEHEQNASRPATATPLITPTASPPPAPPSQTTAQGSGLCYVLGPFTSAAEVQQVVSRTSATVERRWSNPKQRPGYWVHIPPAASGGEARNAVRLLGEAGVADVQLITSGEMKHAVSLGIFSTMENARKRLAEVQKHGFDVAINEVRIRKRQYWLALRGKQGERLPRVMLDNLVKNSREAKVERRPCTSLYQ